MTGKKQLIDKVDVSGTLRECEHVTLRSVKGTQDCDYSSAIQNDPDKEKKGVSLQEKKVSLLTSSAFKGYTHKS